MYSLGHRVSVCTVCSLVPAIVITATDIAEIIIDGSSSSGVASLGWVQWFPQPNAVSLGRDLLKINYIKKIAGASTSEELREGSLWLCLTLKSSDSVLVPVHIRFKTLQTQLANCNVKAIYEYL